MKCWRGVKARGHKGYKALVLPWMLPLKQLQGSLHQGGLRLVCLVYPEFRQALSANSVLLPTRT